MRAVEDLRRKIGELFRIYDVRWDYDAVAFFVDINKDTLEADFDGLRKDLVGKGFIPMLLHEGGEYIIYVTKRAPTTYRTTKWNLALMLATICTTVFVGALNWAAYTQADSGATAGFFDMLTLPNIAAGAFYFAFPLMSILGIHELGHYFMAKRHGVAASLPFFLPVPIPPLGTFGAFISMREPIPDKKALLDIGVSGPLVGFAVAIPVVLIGMVLTDSFHQAVPSDQSGLVYLGQNLLFMGLTSLVPQSGEYVMHPTALAGWVGILVTFLNLLPAGQLDGGHVFRALLGHRAKYASYSAIAGMVVLGAIYGYFGWFLFVLIIFLIGINHPPPLNDITGLDTRRKVVGGLAVALLIGTFTPVPLQQGEPQYQYTLQGSADLTVPPGATGDTKVVLNATGNSGDTIRLSIDKRDLQSLRDRGWNASFLVPAKGSPQGGGGKKVEMVTKNGPVEVALNVGKPKDVLLRVAAPASATADQSIGFRILTDRALPGPTRHREVEIRASAGYVALHTPLASIPATPGTPLTFPLTILNVRNASSSVSLAWSVPAGWGLAPDPGQTAFDLLAGGNASASLTLSVEARRSAERHQVLLRADIGDLPGWTAVLRVTVVIGTGHRLTLQAEGTDVIVPAGGNGRSRATVANGGGVDDQVTLTLAPQPPLTAKTNGSALIPVSAGQLSAFYVYVSAPDGTPPDRMYAVRVAVSSPTTDDSESIVLVARIV